MIISNFMPIKLAKSKILKTLKITTYQTCKKEETENMN